MQGAFSKGGREIRGKHRQLHLTTAEPQLLKRLWLQSDRCSMDVAAILEGREGKTTPVDTSRTNGMVISQQSKIPSLGFSLRKQIIPWKDTVSYQQFSNVASQLRAAPAGTADRGKQQRGLWKLLQQHFLGSEATEG